MIRQKNFKELKDENIICLFRDKNERNIGND